MRRDPHKVFRFGALQSEAGAKVLKEHGLGSKYFTSIVVIDGDEVLHKSRAIYRMLGHMSYPWKIFSVFRFIPAFIADFFYDLFARNRYKMFGQSDQCRLPTPEERERFI